MKKLSILLAVLATATMCLASCGGEATDTTTAADGAATTPAATTTKPAATNPIAPPQTGGETQLPEIVTPELLDGTKFALDGDLSEYAGLHTIEMVGETGATIDTSHKKVTFYGAMTDAGLYLACDAYHDIYIGNGTGGWWTNSNFEIFIGPGREHQKYVHATGIGSECVTSGDDVTAIMITEELTDGPTAYHTITEMFIPTDYLNESDIMYNTMDVGVAWKTIGDLIIGGAGTASVDSSDEYWVPKGTWPDRTKPIVSPSGIWLPDDFEFEMTTGE